MTHVDVVYYWCECCICLMRMLFVSDVDIVYDSCGCCILLV